jgi:hypothetical protein
MKAVLISIQPKWCEFICTFLGYDNRRPLYKKRLDLRKSAPKTTPFKAYIYETQGRTETPWIDEDGHEIFKGRGQVIGEFICDYVVRHCEMSNADLAEEMSCVPREDILKYSNGKEVFGWHISDLVIYDKPKELREFYTVVEDADCGLCRYYDTPYDREPCNQCQGGRKYLERPFQSWGYVYEADT